jgi:hypothetical protein
LAAADDSAVDSVAAELFEGTHASKRSVSLDPQPTGRFRRAQGGPSTEPMGGGRRQAERQEPALAPRVRVLIGRRLRTRASLVRPVLLACLVLAVAACGGTGSSEKSGAAASHERALADGLALLPDEPELRQHVLVSDLERLRRAYPSLQKRGSALAGVWLPDALVGADRALWRDSFGLSLDDVSSFASAGFHPATLTVAEGAFSPARIRGALRRFGYQTTGRTLTRGADGSVDASTRAGQLSLSALNRVIASRTLVTAASTSELLGEAESRPTLAADGDYAAAADALDPITSAIVLDASLVQPPGGVPTPILTAFPARLVAAGIDDLGPSSRTVKIALVYESADQARADAALIERDLPSTPLPGAQSMTFSDLASSWSARAEGRAVVVTASLQAGSDPGTWRSLVDRGDLAVLVRPPG